MVGTEPSKFHTAGLQDPHSGSFMDLGPSRDSLGHLEIVRQQEPIGKTQAMEAVAVATDSAVTRWISS